MIRPAAIKLLLAQLMRGGVITALTLMVKKPSFYGTKTLTYTGYRATVACFMKLAELNPYEDDMEKAELARSVVEFSSDLGDALQEFIDAVYSHRESKVQFE